MKEISVTVTTGQGSETHNHDLDYRNTLSHVHARENGVIELIPHRSYQKQINALMQPFIESYNERQQQRYAAAWERYNTGKIKSKPKKRDYKSEDLDYYTVHQGDTYHNRKTGKQEQLPMYREVILGLGDKSDRQHGTISKDQAVAVFTRIADRWPEIFPDFRLLGATVHLDEEGFYHAHFDYKPLFERATGQGMDCSVSMEAALEHMGYEPEQSIINGRDKAPIRYNAFRNRLYREIEAALADQRLRLQYGASAIKEPSKDSSRNQQLEIWQATQDAVRTLQRQKNAAMDILDKDAVMPDELHTAMSYVSQMKETLEAVEAAPRAVGRKGRVVTFSILDQLKSLVAGILDVVAILRKHIQELTVRLKTTQDSLDAVQRDYADLSSRYAVSEAERQQQVDEIWELEGSMRELADLKEYQEAVRELDPAIHDEASKTVENRRYNSWFQSR